MTPDKLVEELDRTVRVPGLSNIWVPPIRNRIDMLATGIKSPVGVKVAGTDLAGDRPHRRRDRARREAGAGRHLGALPSASPAGATSTCTSTVARGGALRPERRRRAERRLGGDRRR